MGKIVTVVVGLMVFIAAFLGFQMLTAAAKPRPPQEVQAEIEKDVADLKKSLPQDYGPQVTWFDVEAGWQTIIFKYKVRVPREVVVANKKELEAQMKGNMALGVAKFMMPKDVKLRYELYDGGGSFIYTLDSD